MPMDVCCEIRSVEEGKLRFLPLLLLADPCERMVSRYLDAGEVFVMECGGEAVCVAVVVRGEDGECELKNLAVADSWQGRGCGSRMVRFLLDRFASVAKAMLVGTADSGVPFYERFGFEYAFRVPGFFTENYPEPVVEEDGRLCVDMLYCRKVFGSGVPVV